MTSLFYYRIRRCCNDGDNSVRYNVIAKRWRIRCVTKLMRFKPAMCY
jgi:hypothetical protein